jgi:hypothetical protein
MANRRVVSRNAQQAFRLMKRKLTAAILFSNSLSALVLAADGPSGGARQTLEIRGRLVWKKFISPEDCREEYRKWSAALRAARP